MKLTAEVITESCPFQIVGEIKGIGYYYRARGLRWEVWLSEKALTVMEWLEELEGRPSSDYWSTIEDEEDEDELLHALAVIIGLNDPL